MKKRLFAGSLLAGVLLCAFMLSPIMASADHGSDDSTTSTNTSGTSTTTTTTDPATNTSEPETHSGAPKPERTTNSQTEPETAAETEQGTDANKNEDHHFSGTKLTNCEKRQNEIKSIMSRSVERAQNQIDLFSSIASRTEDFYKSKGKTLATYDQLVASIASAKSAAETDLQKLKSENAFTCTAANPSGDVSTFKQALQTEINDLKTFRTTVKNLIVGVKSVQSTTEGNNQ